MGDVGRRELALDFDVTDQHSVLLDGSPVGSAIAAFAFLEQGHDTLVDCPKAWLRAECTLDITANRGGKLPPFNIPASRPAHWHNIQYGRVGQWLA